MAKRQPRLTQSRLTILQLLGEYQCLSSRQIWRELQPEKHYTHTLGELAALRKLEMVQSRPIHPESGNVSQFGWYLLKHGAGAVGINVYGRLSVRSFTREILEQRGLELELARQVRADFGWNLIKPIHYHSSRPLPLETPQGKVIGKFIKKGEFSAIRRLELTDPHRPGLPQKILDYKSGLFEQRIPLQANDYVAYQTCGEESTEINAAVILILCPSQATKKYWQSRIDLYSKVARVADPGTEAKIEVIAVFKNTYQADMFRSKIQAAGFTITTVNQVCNTLQLLQSK